MLRHTQRRRDNGFEDRVKAERAQDVLNLLRCDGPATCDVGPYLHEQARADIARGLWLRCAGCLTDAGWMTAAAVTPEGVQSVCTAVRSGDVSQIEALKQGAAGTSAVELVRRQPLTGVMWSHRADVQGKCDPRTLKHRPSWYGHGSIAFGGGCGRVSVPALHRLAREFTGTCESARASSAQRTHENAPPVSVHG